MPEAQSASCKHSASVPATTAGHHSLLKSHVMLLQGVSWGGPRTSPPVQLMYSWMGFLFSVSRYSIVATSWLPSSSSIALPRKMMRSRYCAARRARHGNTALGLPEAWLAVKHLSNSSGTHSPWI